MQGLHSTSALLWACEKARVKQPLRCVQWLVKQCKSRCVRTQVARIAADAETLENFRMKYGHPELP